MSDHRKGLLAIYAAIFLLATNGIFAKSLPLSSIDITLYRAFVATFSLFIILSWQKVSLRLNSRRDLLIMVVLGIMLIIHWATFFEAMRVSTVAIGMTALYTYPVFTVAIEAFVSRRPVAKQDILVAISVCVGIYIISPLDTGSTVARAGIGWGLVSAMMFALRNVAQRRLLSHYSSLCAVFYQTLVGCLVLLPFFKTYPNALASDQLWWLVLLGILFTALPHTFLAVSLRYLKAKTVAFIGCLQPVLGAAMALIVIHEKPTWNVVAGAVFILGGVIYETVQTSAKREKTESSPIAIPANKNEIRM